MGWGVLVISSVTSLISPTWVPRPLWLFGADPSIPSVCSLMWYGFFSPAMQFQQGYLYHVFLIMHDYFCVVVHFFFHFCLFPPHLSSGLYVDWLPEAAGVAVTFKVSLGNRPSGGCRMFLEWQWCLPVPPEQDPWFLIFPSFLLLGPVLTELCSIFQSFPRRWFGFIAHPILIYFLFQWFLSLNFFCLFPPFLCWLHYCVSSLLK